MEGLAKGDQAGIVSIYEGELASGTHEVRVNGGELSTGVYLYQLKTDSYVATRKLIVLR